MVENIFHLPLAYRYLIQYLKKDMKQCNIRKITKNGQGTYYISIPKELMKELRFKERQKVVVKKYGRGVLIEDWKEQN